MDGVGEAGHVQIALEGVDLATEGVAPHGDIEAAERLLTGGATEQPVGQHDHARTRAEDRHAVGDALADRLDEVERAGQPAHRGRFAARDHERVAPIELTPAAHRGRGRAATFERRDVLAHITLQSEHTDRGRRHHWDSLVTDMPISRSRCN